MTNVRKRGGLGYHPSTRRVNSVPALKNGSFLALTAMAIMSQAINWPLNRLFHCHHFTLSRMDRLHGFGSDYIALLTELVFERSRNEQDNGLEADADDAA